MIGILFTFFIVIIFFLIILEKSTTYLFDQLKYAGRVPHEEFPEINKSDLEKFKSFDSQLGWERQPEERREKEPSEYNSKNEKLSYYTDSYGSRVCKIGRNDGDFNIATFGDSYCWCGEVNNNETIQHYLSEYLGVHVSNYGVGGYGLDQSIMRMKKRYDKDPAEFNYCIMILSDEAAFPRIVSMWRHYHGFGNTFAVKPRYKLLGNYLRLIPSPIEQKEDLLSITEHAEYLRSNDYHYKKGYFENKLLTRPYSKYWFRNFYNIPYAATSVTEYLFRHHESLSSIHSHLDYMQTKWEIKKKVEDDLKYRAKIESEFRSLFCQLLGEFSDFVSSQGATPIFLPVRSAELYNTGINLIQSETIEYLNKEYPQLHVVDPRDKIIENHNSSLLDLCVRENDLGGHPSPYHNKLNAKYLAEKINSLDSAVK